MSQDILDQKNCTSAAYIDAVASHFASVCVVTTEIDGEYFGLTATAVASVTADPPRLLVCVNKSAFSHDKIIQSGRFCVNVLSTAHEDIAKRFAGHTDQYKERFTTQNWIKLSTGAPALKNALASFDCILGELSPQATHSVLFGDVIAVSKDETKVPLLYGERQYWPLGDLVDTVSDDGR
ncbi:MAG: flavin reductase family protein [Alphaproteobacteria bacterium]